MNPEEKVNFPTMRVRCFNIAQLGCVKFVSNFPIQLVKTITMKLLKVTIILFVDPYREGVGGRTPN